MGSIGERRVKLGRALGAQAAVVFAGGLRPRNYAANYAAYRSDSHFLYLVGRHLPDAALVVDGARSTLYAAPPTAEDELWHGPSPSLDALAAEIGCDVRPLDELP